MDVVKVSVASSSCSSCKSGSGGCGKSISGLIVIVFQMLHYDACTNQALNYTRNNDRCYIFPNCSTEQYRQSFFPKDNRWVEQAGQQHSALRQY